jgi:hypothetical protein
MFVAPTQSASEPYTEPAATDAAVEQLDLSLLDEQLVEDLAIALL